MTTTNIYLTFNGNCEDAFTFYKSVFGGEFNYLGHYGDMPAKEPLSAEVANKVMHVGLPIGGDTMLMGDDAAHFFGGKEVVIGTNMSIMISPDSETEARRIFEQLSVGGTVQQALEAMFWGDLYGAFTDKFGIQWKISFPLK
ncbi:MAG: glyoxalase [Bacteroidetes bacterium GWF2_43_63]|nr:MAG: glyoxalase [Bacteroidetes bacterium GWE2_42_42]OFY55483.1 MAG: glyoxalase [Bacteroidetes bacterium GWF2_43_63]HBG69959.1 VOC family protein [Bacteroidales bacterium]HCB62615.1 VOC family protein [Bacteroidales bacterium]HCY23735.1 VOC family protein [Bacteroidales bacterium]